MVSFTRDIRHAFRILLRYPLFTVVAALSLGLGIGANSAIFMMFNSLLWRPLPVASPGNLVSIYSRSPKAPFYEPFSWLEYQDYAADKAFGGLAAYTITECAVAKPGEDAARIYGEAVSGNYFDLLRPRMQAGRGFHASEGRSVGSDPVVVLGHRFWQRRFDGDPGVVGRTVMLNGQPFTVVGVAAPEFHGVFAIYFAPDFWVPITTLPRLSPSYAQSLESREAREFRMIGRLGAGVSITQAQAAASTIATRMASSFPKSNKDIKAFVFREVDTRPEVEIAGAATGVALLFLGVSGLVLLIACANVANLVLARSTARRKEIAMRLALGASRAQVVRQLLVESVILALIAGGVGLLLGSLAADVIGSIQMPTDLPIVFAFEPDYRLALFTLGVSVVAGLAFGLLPALRISRGDLVPALKSTVMPGTGERRFTLSNGLVVLQVAASLVLLIVAGLCLKGIDGAKTIDPGFRTDHRLVASFSPTLIGYDEARSRDFYRRLMDRLRESPAIESAAIARNVPLDFDSSGGEIRVEGRPANDDRMLVSWSVVDEEYFRTAGTRIVRGRGFTLRDTASSLRVAIVNETMARQLWPGQDAIGKRLTSTDGDGLPVEVVGIAADGKYRQLTENPQPYMFLPFSQNPRTRVTVLVAYRKDVASGLSAVREAVKSIDPAMPVFDTKSMDQFMARAMMAPQLSASLAGPAGLLAALIAAIGLYGVMAYSVSRRTQEIGVRVAIGATPRSVLELVMRRGMTLAAIGIAVGLAIALVSTRLISILLFGVTPTDPAVFVGVPLLLAAVAALACYLPARRALKIDPLLALRQE